MSEPLVSIIVLAFNESSCIRQCLAAVDAHVPDELAHEVIVLANGPGAVAELERERERPHVRVVRSNVNFGFGGGCNRVARLARGRLLVFLNDDAEVEPGWLEALTDALESSPTVGAVGSRLIYEDGTLQEAGCVLWSDSTTAAVGRGEPSDSLAYQYRRAVDFCSAASLLVPKHVWEAIGGFDEGFFPGYYEDVDVCCKIRELGLSVVYEPTSRVRHLESVSTSHEYRRFLMQRNHRRFAERWGAALANHVPPPGADTEVAPAIRRAVHLARGAPMRVLVVAEGVPEPSDGARRRRLQQLVEHLAASTAVTLSPASPVSRVYPTMARHGVELLTEPLAEHLAPDGVAYDAALLCGPHSWQRAALLLRETRPAMPIVYDAEGRAPIDPAITADADAVVDGATDAAHAWLAALQEAARRRDQGFRGPAAQRSLIGRLQRQLALDTAEAQHADDAAAPRDRTDEVDALIADVTVKTEYIAQLEARLLHLQEKLPALEAEVASTREQLGRVEAELEEVMSRASMRLLNRAHLALQTIPGAERAAKRLVRRLGSG